MMIEIGLLHGRDRRFALHRAATRQPPDGLRHGELTPLADFPLRDWMARLDGTLRPDDRTTGRRLRDFVP